LALYVETDKKGYLNLKIQKTDGRRKEITSFTTLQEAKDTLFRITVDYKLCQKLTGLYLTKKACFQYNIKECDGACIGEISPEEYNSRVQEFLTKNSFESQNMIVTDKGRNISERSAVLIENGVYKGYTFYDLNYQIHKIEILKNILIPMQNNRDTRNIIQSHIRKSKYLKIIKF
jgi:DNA polymerase-3 subunit epsilon